MIDRLKIAQANMPAEIARPVRCSDMLVGAYSTAQQGRFGDASRGADAALRCYDSLPPLLGGLEQAGPSGQPPLRGQTTAHPGAVAWETWRQRYYDDLGRAWAAHCDRSVRYIEITIGQQGGRHSVKLISYPSEPTCQRLLRNALFDFLRRNPPPDRNCGMFKMPVIDMQDGRARFQRNWFPDCQRFDSAVFPVS